MARHSGRGHRLRRALAQAQARRALDDRAVRRRLSELPGRSASADSKSTACRPRKRKRKMMRHRLLLTFLLAFSLGVIAAVYLIRHEQDVARESVVGEMASTASGAHSAAD